MTLTNAFYIFPNWDSEYRLKIATGNVHDLYQTVSQIYTGAPPWSKLLVFQSVSDLLGVVWKTLTKPNLRLLSGFVFMWCVLPLSTWPPPGQSASPLSLLRLVLAYCSCHSFPSFSSDSFPTNSQTSRTSVIFGFFLLSSTMMCFCEQKE